MLIPVILAGGSGTRLWPLSRELYPKQLMSFNPGGPTLLQQTVERLRSLPDVMPPVVLCNENHRFMVAEQLQEMGVDATIILEPVARNTAPAVAIGALHAKEMADDPLLLVLPADHLIADTKAFSEGIRLGCELAASAHLITFGIVPTEPHTGYGYIKKGEPFGNPDGTFQVARFEEKPDLPTAQMYCQSGEYLWNSGMFMFKASTYLSELESLAPEILSAASQAYDKKTDDLDFTRLGKKEFSASPSISIDYAVMEKTRSAAVIPLDCGWSDLGSWPALWEASDKDKDGNATIGEILVADTKNSYLHSTQRLVASVGLEDVVVVETADAVLVAAKNRAQDVKAIVKELRKNGREEAALHRRVYRPWGSYECIDSAERYQVKRITVKPGASLSLQMHYHRAEHWIVVRGTAKITKGDQTLILTENQSTYIPLGETHRLENPGLIPLELIEVQSGSYLGEDDIVRFEDDYGRTSE